MRTDQQSQLGSFDFHSLIFEISGCNARHKKIIEDSLKSSADNETVYKTLFKKSTIIHEATHFTDTTSTLWGLEYIFRKNHFIHSLRKGLKADTFMLNESEIALHRSEVITHNKNLIKSSSKINFSVFYSNKFGALLYIHFSSSDEIFLSVPISMLSLLEANAIANDSLSLIHSSKKLSGEKKEKTIIEINEKRLELMTDPKRTEYNVLIFIIDLYFNFLSQETRLVFTSCLCRACLNFNQYELTKFASIIEKFCTLDLKATISLSMDLRRGLNRASLFFFISSIIKSSLEQNLITESDLISSLESSPYEFLNNFLEQRLGVEKYAFATEMEINTLLDGIKNNNYFNDYEIVSKTANDIETLNKTPLALAELEKISLLDFFLPDESVVSPPNRLDIDISERLIENIEIARPIDNHYIDNEMYKNHLKPEHALATYLNVMLGHNYS